jgi:dephospho-CoA kinase
MTPLPKLILLAGTTEAGKSTAGQYLRQLGAVRQKIRDILLTLTSGELVSHEGAATRQGFDPAEFMAVLRASAADLMPSDILVVESFIDAELAVRCQNDWPSRALIVFIDAPFGLRVSRLMAASGLPAAEARRVVDAKDERKRAAEQMPLWGRAAGLWIDNIGTIDEYQAALRRAVQLLSDGAGD